VKMRENPQLSAPKGRRERVFVVGLDYRSRLHGEVQGAEGAKNAARQAREAAPRASEKTRSRGLATLGSPLQTIQAQAAPGTADGGLGRKASRGSRFTAEESLAELRELAASAGGEVAGEFLQPRAKPDPATLVGRGKLEEIAGAAAASRADLIIFDHDLTPSQQRNLEKMLPARVIDRTQLILDIFARHARTREGQLQVELAQLEYLTPRLAGRGKEMSQLGGGIGTRGPGETQLETDRRRIYGRIRRLRERLEEVRRIRAQQRQRRASVPVATVALVGYTNAGKSTLFNALTKAGVPVSPKMFATLDPTIRAVELPSKRQVLLSDTVGFIRHLPHTLVSAFRATLEEVERAALILHISDASSPAAAEQNAQVETVLGELNARDRPRLRVFNKIDLLSPWQRESLRDTANTVHISAAQGAGLSTLLEAIDSALVEDPLRRVRVRVPQSEGKVLSQLQSRARIYARHYRDGAVEMEVAAAESLLRRLRQFVVE